MSLILIKVLVKNLLEGMLNAIAFCSKANIGRTMEEVLVIFQIVRGADGWYRLKRRCRVDYSVTVVK